MKPDLVTLHALTAASEKLLAAYNQAKAARRDDIAAHVRRAQTAINDAFVASVTAGERVS